MSAGDRKPGETLEPDPRQMSQAELNDYLDRLVTQGLDDTPEFHQAYKIWERNQ